jgi:chemotaxis protein MotB
VSVENQKLKSELAKSPQASSQDLTQASHVSAPTKTVSSDEAHQLEERLAKAFDLKGQQVTVSQDDRGLVISFQERIFFDPGAAELTPKAHRTLDSLAKVLGTLHQPIRVEGHTDNTPIKTAIFPSNWELSTARATRIVRSLVERYHLSPQQLSAAGYGEFSPLSDNSTIEGKQKNRRVDIVILNPLPTGTTRADRVTESSVSPSRPLKE